MSIAFYVALALQNGVVRRNESLDRDDSLTLN
jgi:hypothetical protein